MTAALATHAPRELWLSAAEIAGLDLPGLSPKRNRLVEMAAAGGWADRVDAAGQALARKRAGRGGGWEYSAAILPVAAVQELTRRGLFEPVQEAPQSAFGAPLMATKTAANDASAWSWFETQPDKVRDEAQARLSALQAVMAQEAAGLGVNAAVSMVAQSHAVSVATVFAWRKLVTGVPAADWLPALAPRRKGGGKTAEVDPRIIAFFKSYKLRLGPQGYEESRRKTVAYALTLGLTEADVPCTKTLTRALIRTTPKRVRTLKTQGMEAVVRSVPAQRRTREALASMEAVNIDGHKWDCFVRWPDGRIGRPISVVIQDLASNKIVGHRMADVESAISTRLALGDMARIYGIPLRLLADNGRAFTSKWITGGMLYRNRFKVKAEEPLGILTQLGVKVTWATPGHGQAKPIERCFGDLEQSVAGDPRCQGAWTGKKPTAKPEDYASKAVDLADFQQIVESAIAEYNARPGRRGGNAQGRSYDATFAARMTSPVGRASPEQLRLFLLTAENVRAHKTTGEVKIFGNSYYARELYELAGQMVTVRFDPDNLHSDVQVYATDGRFVCAAPIQAAVGFFDVQGAKDRKRLVSDLRKSTREADRLQGLLSAADLAAMVPMNVTDAAIPAPNVIRPVRRGGARLAPVNDQASFRDQFMAGVENLAGVDPAGENRRNFRVFDGGLSPQQEPERPQN